MSSFRDDGARDGADGADGDTKQQMGAVLYPGMSAEDGSMVLAGSARACRMQRAARFHMSDSVWVKTADDVFVPDENFLGHQ